MCTLQTVSILKRRKKIKIISYTIAYVTQILKLKKEILNVLNVLAACRATFELVLSQWFCLILLHRDRTCALNLDWFYGYIRIRLGLVLALTSGSGSVLGYKVHRKMDIFSRNWRKYWEWTRNQEEFLIFILFFFGWGLKEAGYQPCEESECSNCDFSSPVELGYNEHHFTKHLAIIFAPTPVLQHNVFLCLP